MKTTSSSKKKAPAPHAPNPITLTAVVARRASDGRLVLLLNSGADEHNEIELEESSDGPLDLYSRLKKSRGENGRYSSCMLFLRAKTNKRLQLTR